MRQRTNNCSARAAFIGFGKCVPNKQTVIFSKMTLLAGSSWDNAYNMVFTRDNGMFIRFKTLYVHFKALVSKLNRPEVRFHDIRHTYATLAIQSEIDFKTLSLSLGHATVAFTLDTYGHVSNRMSQNAADKMEKFIGTL